MVPLNWRLNFVLVTVTLVLVVLVAPGSVLAAGTPKPTTIKVTVPAQLDLGQRVSIQAVLLDNTGRPVPKALVYFTSPGAFLNVSGSMVVAQALTNKSGQAVAEFESSVSGSITLQAEFRGNDRYAASSAAAQISVQGDQQLYVDHVGVQIPGLNVSPVSTDMLSEQSPIYSVIPLIVGLWPALTGWPIAVVLIVVWALYLVVVRLIFRVTAAGSQSPSPVSDVGGPHD